MLKTKKRGPRFPRALKREIAIEYVKTGVSRQEISLKYDLPNLNTITSWVNSYLTPYEVSTKCLYLQHETEPQKDMSEEEKKNKIEQAALIERLEKQVKQLEAELKLTKDKNIALNTMIDIAEEQGIRIRKKSGAKR